MKKIWGIILIAILMAAAAQAADKRVLYVNSYNGGLNWPDDILTGIRSVFEGKNILLDTVEMDTLNNASEEAKQEAALRVKAMIDRKHYDAVIASDDNASKYLIMPYYRDADIPFVFCGVNWDASVYGYPYKNVTGMVEVSPVPVLMSYLKTWAKGNRIAVLGPDRLTVNKTLENFRNVFNLEFETKLIRTFDEWKAGFVEIQNSADMLVLMSTHGIEGWDDAGAEKFVLENIRIPVGTDAEDMKICSLIGFIKIGREHGEYAAATVLKILGGTSPSEIPVVNSQKGDLILNMKIAEKLGIRFPLKIVTKAKKENIIR